MPEEISRIELVRNDDLELRVWVHAKIGSYIEEQSGADRESGKWSAGSNMLKYRNKSYKGDYKKAMSNKYDEFGSEFIKAMGRDMIMVNLAILRTKDISKTDGVVLKLDNGYSEEALLAAIRQLKEHIGYIWKNFIKPVRISCKIVLEELV